MSDLIELFQYEWAIRAILSSSMVGVMCGLLGCFIVLRNMSLIGDALAHAILPGVVFAFMIVGYSALGFFTGAVLAGLITAICITWIQQNVKTKNDAAIGIVFTAMFSIGVMGISGISKNQGVHLDLKDFLFGNLLGVADQDLYLTASVLVIVIISIIIFYRYLFATTFQPIIAQTMGISVTYIHYFLMLLLSFAVVASLQAVGVILVVAMLITPASTALLLSNRLQIVLVLSGIIGFISAFLGFLLAYKLETTPGPAMAVTATLIYLLAVIAAPQRGLIAKYNNRQKLRIRINLEDILKEALRLQKRNELSKAKLKEKLGFSNRRLSSYLIRLHRKNYFSLNPLRLTNKGESEAKRLVRAHRLWETYLVDKMGLAPEHIHEEAERYEHFLSDELLDQVDQTLGFPTEDPHGSPIPGKGPQPKSPLSRLEVLQEAKIAAHQISENVSAQLWKIGLLPNMSFSIHQKEKDFIAIKTADKKFKLPRDFARKINIEKLKIEN